MSNKPKRELPLHGKVTTPFESYCERFRKHAISVLKKQGSSKHQGGKPLQKQYAALHASCNRD